MIKKITIDQLQPGMYVADLNCDWIVHHNYQKQGLVNSQALIEDIRKRGITELYIDPSKGADVNDALTAKEVDANNQLMLDVAGAQKIDKAGNISVEEELHKATNIHNQALSLIKNVLHDVKLSRPIDVDAFDNVADGMVDSVLRNHNALACLGRIRDKDNYLLEHSVNLAVLMGIFAKSMQIDRETIHQVVIGAMLHDIGKVLIPDAILHKPGKLTDNEFQKMKHHVVYSRNLLKQTPGISQLTVDVAAQHHERIDGSGYPDGLHSHHICTEGKMCAISDVYDAITSDRVYHKAMPPTQALKKLLEWSGSHLDQELVHRFIRAVGIYPVGSLVLLKSNRLAVVIEPSEKDQRLPTVKVIYSAKSKHFLPIEIIDLSRPGVQDEIVQAVNPEQWRIKVKDFL